MAGVVKLRPFKIACKNLSVGLCAILGEEDPYFYQLSREETGPTPLGLWKASVGKLGAHIFFICLSLLPFLVCHDHPTAKGFKHRVIAIGSSWLEWEKKGDVTGEAEKGLGERETS